MKKLLLSASILFLMFSCQNEDVSAPETVAVNELNLKNRGCASDYMLEYQLKQDPTLAKRMADIEAHTKETISLGRIVNGVIEIPVVFNVLYRTTADNISLSQIQSQIDVLNQDFNGTNPDFNTPNNPYSSVRANVGIRFVLDQVIRKSSTKTVWYSEDGYMKIVSQGGIAATTPTTKLNVWVVNNLRRKLDNSQLLGYAQFPGGASATDGYVCGNYCTGTNGTAAAPYNLGRTATHEIGHWMNLRHIWGDATCGSDSVSDTPVHNAPNFGVPAVGHKSTCSGTPLEMYMNYMDYTDDRGMYMFSNGQKTRMTAVFAVGGSRASFRL